MTATKDPRSAPPDVSPGHSGPEAPSNGWRTRPGPRIRVTALAVVAAAGLAGAALAVGLVPRPAAPAGEPRVKVDLPVTATDLYDKPSNNSPVVVADPTDRRFVALANRLDAPFSCALQVSGDAGRTWVTALPTRQLPAGADTCYAPEVAFDSNGVLYFLYVGLAGAGNRPMGVFLTTSTDRARSFSEPVAVLGPNRYQVRMAVDPESSPPRLHLAWLEVAGDPPLGGLPDGDNPIMTAHSDDGGASFSPPRRVSSPARQRAVAPALALGRAGAVHVLYYDLVDDARDYQGLSGPVWSGFWSLVLATSTDGGESFTEVPVDEEITPPERVMLIFTMPAPALAVDGRRIYAAWHDGRTGDWDVYLRASADGGKSWEGAVRVNDDASGNGRHQFLPRLAVAGGRVDAVFYDRRNNVENRGNDVFYTWSGDGGATFAPNRRLTSLDSDSTVGPQYAVASAQGLVEFGGRIALLSERRSALAAWTDTRYTATSNTSQDIFATRIDHPGGGRPGWMPWVGAGVVGAAALLASGLARRRRRVGATP